LKRCREAAPHMSGVCRSLRDPVLEASGAETSIVTTHTTKAKS
jgi:hypothetical protein